MKGNIWGIVVIACVLALALPAVDIGFSNAAQPGNATENATVDYDLNYTVGEDPVYEYTNLTVTSNGTDLRAGTDYQFDAENGTINWIDTAETSDGDAAEVAYAYEDHSQTTTNQRNILATVATPLGFVLMLVVFGAMLTLIFRDPY